MELKDHQHIGESTLLQLDPPRLCLQMLVQLELLEISRLQVDIFHKKTIFTEAIPQVTVPVSLLLLILAVHEQSFVDREVSALGRCLGIRTSTEYCRWL